MAAIDLSNELQMLSLVQGQKFPPSVEAAGFFDLKPPECDTEYAIQGTNTSEMQLLHISLKRYQTVVCENHDNMAFRTPTVSVTRGGYGMRFKNMTGTDGHLVALTPGFVAKIVPLKLEDYPELVIKPELFLAAFDGNIRREWEMRPVPGKFKLPLYNALHGTGVVFLRTGGASIFRYLEEGGSIVASAPNITAFQTFCEIKVRSVPSPDKSIFSSNPQIFPHALVHGPGLVMLSALYHDEKIYPLMLDQFPQLMIRPEIFLAASDPHIGIRAERMQRKGTKSLCGGIMIGISGSGVLFLKLAGITRFQVLKATETIYLSTATLAAYQQSCKAVEEDLPAPPAKEFKDVKITGPGLVIMQGSNTRGRPLPHLTGGGCSLPAPTKKELKALKQAHKNHKCDHHTAAVRRGSATPARPVAGSKVIKGAEEHRKMLAVADAAVVSEKEDASVKLLGGDESSRKELKDSSIKSTGSSQSSKELKDRE